MSLGTPKGRARMPAVTMAVPPPPPIPMTASRSLRVGRNAAKASAMAVTAVPRSSVAGMAGAAMSGAMAGARVPTSTRRGLPPASRMRAARKASSSPLVSAVPTT